MNKLSTWFVGIMAVIAVAMIVTLVVYEPPPRQAKATEVPTEEVVEEVTRDDALEEIRDDVTDILSGKDTLNESYWGDPDMFNAQIDQKRSINMHLGEIEGYDFDEQDQAKIDELSGVIDVYIDGVVAWSEYKLENSNAPKQKEKAAFLKDFYAEKVQEALDQLQ